MNPAELQLQPLHAPPAPWAWFPTPFEWVLLVLVGLTTLYLLKRAYRFSQHRRELQRWRRVRTELSQRLATDPKLGAETTSRLVRKLAGRLDQDPSVARLTGEAWLERLDALTRSQFFTSDAGRSLIDAPYKRAIHEQQIPHLLAAFDLILEVYVRQVSRRPARND